MRTLLRQLGRWRVPVGWYGFAVAAPCALAALGALLAVMLGAGRPTLTASSDWILAVATFVQVFILVAGFEELGWRGFALPRMQQRHSAVRAALGLGVVWALWHLPELVSDITRQRPWAPYVVWVVAQSVVLTWIYNSTGRSLAVVMAFHAAVNTSVRYLLPEVAAQDYLTYWWAMVAVYVMAATAVVLYAGPITLARAPGELRRPSDVTHDHQ